MREGEGVALARRCLDEAHEGNSVSLRFALGRIEPTRRGRPVTLDLLPGEERDVHAVLARAIRAVAAGELTPEEAFWIGRLTALKRATPLEPGLPNAPWDALDPEEWEVPGMAADDADDDSDAAGDDDAEGGGTAADPECTSPRLRAEVGGGDAPLLCEPTGTRQLPPPAPPPQAGEEREEGAADVTAGVAPGRSAPSPSHRLGDGPLPLPGGARESGGARGSEAAGDGETCFPPVFISPVPEPAGAGRAPDGGFPGAAPAPYSPSSAAA
jgi:hypothetical protein